MATYNSFIFEGHGTSEKTGGYDPGAVNGATKENDLVDKIVTKAMEYLKNTGLSIHRDENNYSDDDLVGNIYTAKCGISVHINAGGGNGVEIYVPCKEKYLTTDFTLASDISKILVIPNRGIKSRDYNSENTFTRTDGIALEYTDYYKEIRNAWSLGISLCILEVGFIDSTDLLKIQSNIDKLGFLVAKYIAKNCDITLDENTSSNNEVTASNSEFYRVICGSFKDRNNAEIRKKELESKGFNDVFIDIYGKKP